MRDLGEARSAAVLAVVLDQHLNVVTAVGRPGRDPGTSAGRDIAQGLVAPTGPDASHRLRQIDRALHGERVTFSAAVGERRMACTAEPLSVTDGAATHVLIMVDDSVPSELVVPELPHDGRAVAQLEDGPGPVHDRAQHLDDGDCEVLTQLAAGRTQTSIATALRLTRRGLDHRIARLRRNLDETSLTLTGLVASTYAAGILVPGAWPPRTRDPLSPCEPIRNGSA